jgi:hypothetical protein
MKGVRFEDCISCISYWESYWEVSLAGPPWTRTLEVGIIVQMQPASGDETPGKWWEFSVPISYHKNAQGLTARDVRTTTLI